MGQAYSDPKRASMPHALPDVEVWCDRVSVVSCRCGDYDVPLDSAHATGEVYCPSCERPAESVEDTDREAWWWWSCFPGCMPDSDPFGPFETEQEALEDAQSNAGWDEDEQEGD